MIVRLGLLLSFALWCEVALAGELKADDQNWPGFRGWQARGVSEGNSTPVSWDVEKGEHVLWKVPIPGLAHSSPVIWGDSVFLTTAVSGRDDTLRVGLYGDIKPVEGDASHSWQVHRLDKRNGRLIWSKTAHEGVPKTKRHPKSTHANSSPATDGRHVVAFFGSEGLFCYDFSGKLLWKKDFGVLESSFYVAPEAQWGFASSPVIHDGKVFIQCDVLKDSFVAAYNIENGDLVWRTSRNDVPTWSTPTVYADGQRSLLLVNGWKHIGGYDLRTGEEVWNLRGGGDIPVPTPIVAHELVYVTNAHGRASPIYAIRLNARGDISLEDGASSNKFVAWSIGRGGAYMQTPIVYGDYLYNCRDNGVLSCYQAKTGQRLYQERLGGGGGFSASSVAGDGKLYFTSETGDVFVVGAGPEFELLAVNALDEVTLATPAMSGGVLFFRTRSHLLAVGD